MSDVKVTTLANGLRVAVDEMPEVESASLGIWVACGTRHESAELNGMAHMLEHMAFKGTRTRSARAIAEEIENVGGSLNAYTGREITAYHASVLKEDVGAGRRAGLRHPAQLGVRSRRAAARARRHPAGDRPGARHAGRRDLRPVPGDRVARPAARPAGAGHRASRSRRSAATISSPIWRATTRPPTWSCRRPGRVEHDRIVELAEKHFGSRAAHAGQRRAAGAAALCRRRRPRGARAGAGPPGAGLRGHRLSRSRLLRARRLLDPVRRRHVLAPVPAHPRGARPGLRHPLLQHGLCRRRPVRHLCRHRRGRPRRAGARRSARNSSGVADTLAARPSWCAPATRSRPAR